MVDKAPDAFRTISEVADDLDLPQHVLRFWETRFQQIKPLKRGGGRRYYRPDDIDLLRGIQHLLYGEGYTIRGAQRILKDHGVKFVQNVWRPGADAAGARAEARRAGDRPSPAGASAARTGTARARRTPRIGACSGCCRRSCRSGHRRGAPGGKPRRRHGGPSDHALAGDAIQPSASAATLPAEKLTQAAGHAARPAGMPQAARRGGDRRNLNRLFDAAE